MNDPWLTYIAIDPKIKIEFPTNEKKGAVVFTWNPIYKYAHGEMLEEVTDV